MTTAEMIRRFFKRASVDLDPAADEAVFDRIRAAYVKDSEYGPAPSRPILWRHIMRRPFTKWGIAAAVAMAGLIGLSFWRGTGAGIVLADVLTRVQQANAFLYQTKIARTGPQAVEETRSTLISRELGIRTVVERLDPNTGQNRIEEEQYMSLKEGAYVIIVHSKKMYMRGVFNDETAEFLRRGIGDPRDILSHLQACKYTSLGRSMVEGVEAEGFQTTDPNYFRPRGGTGAGDAKVWVAVETRLPVRMEDSFQREDGTLVHEVTTQYQWNATLDAAQFEPVIPDGYTSPVNGPIAMPTVNEESAIQGLRLYLELGGQYPEALDQRVLALPLRRIAREGITKEELKKDKVRLTIVMGQMSQLAGLATFQQMLVQENRDPAYHGDRVTPEFPHGVLMRWRLDDGQYEVIFGDLSVRTVTPDELAKLEAAPLNQKPCAIHSLPVDRTIGCRTSGLTLQWMPGLGAAEHRVYLGDSPEALSLAAVVKDPCCSELPALRRDTWYYWRVDEVQADGSTTPGQVWSLNTGGLAAWWRFDESEGATALDSARGIQGDLHNMSDASWVAGVHGKALRFDGVDDYVEAPRLIQSDWTISLWVNTAETAPVGQSWVEGHGLVDGAVQGSPDDFGMSLLGDKAAFGISSPAPPKGVSMVLSTTAVNDGRWHHLVATRDAQSGEMAIYIDGRMEATTTGPHGTKDAPQTLCIGSLRTHSGFFKGDIDEVRLYTYCLSDTEVASLYQEQAP